jgi:hypothetical protein
MNPEEENELNKRAQELSKQITENAKRLGISPEQTLEFFIRKAMGTGEFDIADLMADLREAVTDPPEKIEDDIRRLRETETDEDP